MSKKPNRNTCPNCGAPFEESNKCPFCGTIYYDFSCIRVGSICDIVFEVDNHLICTTAFVRNMSLTCAVESLPEIDLSFVLHNVKQKEIENER